jgi:tRNA (guanine26-N2/guanine27-N2)-dimethyltransferase
MVIFDFETEEIEEGKANILVPKTARGKGPGKIEGVPFYNPVMVVNRDISVLLIQKWLSGRKKRILDGLAGTGIRGIRLALEVKGEFSVLLNDWNESSFELMGENIKRNGVQNAEASQEDLNIVLARDSYDYVDVDPYGTPVPFLDSALKAVQEEGILAVTATDTAALAGSYPGACKRKYGAQPLQSKTRHEIGLRILIGYCARSAAKYQRGIRPILSHSTDHYYRTYLEIEEGEEAADSCMREVGYHSRNTSTQEIVLSDSKMDDSEVAGPLWIGNLWEPVLLQEMRPRLYMSSKTSKILELLKYESQIESPFYSSDEIASSMGVLTPPMARILESLKDDGFAASPTHFDPKGFRTDAPIDQILAVFKGV